MQTLLSVYKDYDRGHLRIIAELCGIPSTELSKENLAQDLENLMLNQAVLDEILEGMESNARAALEDIQAVGGRMTSSEMEHRYGTIRRMGAGRRDEEKPWRKPVSTHEYLWYAGFIAHAFADSSQGPREFAFIPSDLLSLLPQVVPESQVEPGAAAAEPEIIRNAGAFFLDDATTILAALRRRSAENFPPPPERRKRLATYLIQPDSALLLITVMMETHLIGISPLTPDPDRTREFLEMDRGIALTRLFLAWQESHLWNDLANTPGVSIVGGEWPNEPAAGRKVILDYLARIPVGTWWSLRSFIDAIFLDQPDFQRPAGDFDSWYLKNTHTGSILRGLEDWALVEGALIRYLITGPLHWLGIADLGFRAKDDLPTSFRLTEMAKLLTEPERKFRLPAWDAQCQVKPTGVIIVPRKCSHLIRYQISRFAAWRGYALHDFKYQLTPTSMEEANQSGLQIHHILTILEQASGGKVPAAIQEALETWGKGGSAGQIKSRFVLRIRDQAALATLRENRSTARFLSQSIGPDAIEVRAQDWEQLVQNALKLNIWLELPDEAGLESP
jgi:hypothetical protein